MSAVNFVTSITGKATAQDAFTFGGTLGKTTGVTGRKWAVSVHATTDRVLYFASVAVGTFTLKSLQDLCRCLYDLPPCTAKTDAGPTVASPYGWTLTQAVQGRFVLTSPASHVIGPPAGYMSQADLLSLRHLLEALGPAA